MKKNHFFLSLILLFVLVTSNAQQKNTTFGIQAGTNYARYTPRFPIPTSEDVRFTGKIGFYLGGFVNIRLSEQLRIQPSLIFASQGSKFKNENIEIRDNQNDPGRLVDFESNINESTIVVPILLQNHFGDKFYIEAGPQLGYILDRKDKIIEDPFNTNSNTASVPNYDKFDAGLTVGLGYKLSENLGLNTRYFFGVIKRDNDLKSSVLNLGFEYSF